MRSRPIEELKLLQREVLDDIVQFCQEHGLRYTLAYGTLLGALRHKGYIPWDDDIDIHMPRPDYEKFLSLYNNRNSDDSVVTHEMDRRYHVPFAKVYRKGTIVKEFFYKQSVFGAYVDIFPIDGIKDERQAWWCDKVHVHKDIHFLRQAEHCTQASPCRDKADSIAVLRTLHPHKNRKDFNTLQI